MVYSLPTDTELVSSGGRLTQGCLSLACYVLLPSKVKTKILESGPITSWKIDGKVETVIDFIFLGFTIIAGDNCLHAIKTHLLFVRKATTNLIKKQRHHFVDKAPYS